MSAFNLIVLDGLCEQLHIDGLVQLVLVQHLDEEVQRTLVDAHLRVQRADLLVDVHAALGKSPDTHTHTLSRLGHV